MEITQWMEEFELYLSAAKRRPNTIAQYRKQLNGFAAYMRSMGIEKPEEITRRAFRHWAAEMSERWKESTLRQAIIMVNNFLRFVANEGVPMENLEGAVLLPKVHDEPQRTLSVKEISRLSKFVESLEESILKRRNLAMVSLMVDAGLRAFEMCSLRVKDVNLDSGVIKIEGKGGDWGRAFFGLRTSRALRVWLTERTKWLNEHGKEDPGTVFISIGGRKRGTPLTPDGLRGIIKKLGNDAGIPDVTPHAFRRSFATFTVLYQGVPTRVVQVMGRWNSLLMVERYTKALDDPDAVDPKNFTQYAPLDRILEKGAALTNKSEDT